MMGGLFLPSGKTENIGDVAARLLPRVAEARASAPDSIPDLALQPAPAETQPQVVFWLASARKLAATGHAAEYRVWLGLQHLNRAAGGPGRVDMSGAGLQALADLLGLSRHTLRVLLEKKAGLLWRKVGTCVSPLKQEKVSEKATQLACDQQIADPFEPDTRCAMPLDWLALRLEAFQGALLDAWVSELPGGQFRSTWAILSSLWGHPARTLDRWAKAARMSKQHNAGFFPLDGQTHLSDDDLAKLEDYVRSNPGQFGFRHRGLWVRQHKGQAYLCFQRGNTLTGNGSRRTATAGRALKINREIRRCAGENGGQAIMLGVQHMHAKASHDGLTSPTDFLVGGKAGQHLDDRLDDLLPVTNGGLSAWLAEWNKLAKTGRLFCKRTNFQSRAKFLKARNRRPGRTMHWLARRVVMSYGAGWNFWETARP